MLVTSGLAGLLFFIGAGSTSAQVLKRSDEGASAPVVENDIPYADGDDERKLDLYIPNGHRLPNGHVRFGGGWHTGSRKSVSQIGTKFQSVGFGFAVLPSHRLSPKDKFPAQIEDVAAAFASRVKAHIADKGGDPKRVFLIRTQLGSPPDAALGDGPEILTKYELTPRKSLVSSA